MGLSAKQVSSDQGIIDWEAAELSNPPPPTQRQPPRQQEMEEVKCPRCDSTNTKFCYYNNYNKSQPRHFCKSCKRHWTKGGTLRNVPVGGDRKNKRPRISNAPSTSAAAPIMGPTLTTHYTNRNTDFTKMGPIKDSQLTNENTGIRMCNDQKDVSSMIYEALIGSSSSPSLNESIPIMGSNNKTVNETGVFQFSSLSGNFDVNSLIPNSCGYDQFGGNFDSMEDSTITTVNITGNRSGPLPGPDTSYWNWNWNEIDVLTSADHLNIVWDDDSEIKP